ncbi:hypothetical protein [Streptomyces sp. NPDC002164]|uniref:hypothetical protein n=1 Tax=Streptomyces sp. NPDC002164 TaxID=3364633 RepID=UPI0036A3E073
MLSGDRGLLAARVGWVGTGGLWQLDVLRKYGRVAPALESRRRPAGTKPAPARPRTDTWARPGWNYVLSERPEASALFRAAADLLGPDRGTVADDGHRPVLCLAEAVPCDELDTDWELGSSHRDPRPEARLIEALALAGARTGAPTRSSYVLGLRTDAYGCVHTGRLTLALDHSLMWCSGAERSVTGECNALHGEQVAGEYAHSAYFGRGRPVPVPAVPWPYTADRGTSP